MSAAAGAGPSSTPVFDVGLFVDNDSDYIAQVKTCDTSETKIKTHKVAGTQYFYGVPLTSPSVERHMAKLSDGGRKFGTVVHAYLKYLAKVERKSNAVEEIDEGSGIQEADVRVVNEWVAANTGKQMVVLFDFDRTITTVEGGFYVTNTVEDLLKAMSPITGNTDGLTAEDMVDYYVGGPKRVAMLQEMFDSLYSAGNITVYVLTNNMACVRFPTILMQMMNVLTRSRPVKLLCSASYGGNKKSTILATKELKHLCNMRGGKKTRKRKGKKKATLKMTLASKVNERSPTPTRSS